MSFSNPLWWFAIVALCMALGAAYARSSTFYRERLDEAGGGRFGTIDGLRGYLALGVFGTHAVNMYTLHTGGEWAAGVVWFWFQRRRGRDLLAREDRPQSVGQEPRPVAGAQDERGGRQRRRHGSSSVSSVTVNRHSTTPSETGRIPNPSRCRSTTSSSRAESV